MLNILRRQSDSHYMITGPFFDASFPLERPHISLESNVLLDQYFACRSSAVQHAGNMYTCAVVCIDIDSWMMESLMVKQLRNRHWCHSVGEHRQDPPWAAHIWSQHTDTSAGVVTEKWTKMKLWLLGS